MSATGQQSSESTVVRVSLSRFLVYFLKLGTLPFGGPIALAGHMQRDLVEGRRWAPTVGAIAGAAFILARQSLIVVPTVLIAIMTCVLLTATKKIPERFVILAASIVGMFLHGDIR